MAESSEHYAWKEIPGSSHDLLRERIRALPAGLRLLDLGAAGGHLGRAVRDRCAFLAGVEPDPALRLGARGLRRLARDRCVAAGTWTEPFDAVVCADVLEHRQGRGPARPHPRLAACGRHALRLAAERRQRDRPRRPGRRPLPYADRGILDRTHLRFYTPDGLRAPRRRRFRPARWRTAMPYSSASFLARAPWRGPVRAFASGSARVWPTLFGYQFVIESTRQ